VLLTMWLVLQVFGIKRVIATASRPETVEWVKKMGATDVVNHREDIGRYISHLAFA
jgi:NADPH2:quinone reductase